MEKFRATIGSDESKKFLQFENCVASDLCDDDLDKNIDMCIGDIDEIIEQSCEISPLSGETKEPSVGMEFNTREDAREFYIAYGRQTGFTVRIHHNRRSRVNNTVIGQDFVCSKEGFREKKYICRKDRVLPPPPMTREGCPAMLRVALRDGVKWVVTKFVKEHNHVLMSPSKVPWRGSAKSMIDEDDKDRRIRELTIELNNERQRFKRQCAAYQNQLQELLRYVEEHTDYFSHRVKDVVRVSRSLKINSNRKKLQKADSLVDKNIF